MNTLDPYAVEIHYSLDMLGYLLHAERARSVRICSDSAEMAKAIVRRLSSNPCEILVQSESIAGAVWSSLGIRTCVAGEQPAEIAVLPFPSPETTLPAENVVVAAARNPVSYKTVLHPGSVQFGALAIIRRLQKQYSLHATVGMYSPRFIAIQALAQLTRRWSDSTYYRLSDMAMQHIYEFGPAWRFSYVICFAARR